MKYNSTKDTITIDMEEANLIAAQLCERLESLKQARKHYKELIEYDPSCDTIANRLKYEDAAEAVALIEKFIDLVWG